MDRRLFLTGSMAGSMLALTGCMKNFRESTPRSRLDEGDPLASVKTIGDWTVFDNALGLPVSGVGLVIGLAGTGGGAPPGDFRTKLEDQLAKRGFEKPRAMIDDPRNSMVFISAMIPAGVRKGDPLDLEVTIPQGSKTRSLKGGYLTESLLVNYDTEGNVRDALKKADFETTSDTTNRLRLGSSLVRGEGPLNMLVGQKIQKVARGQKDLPSAENDTGEKRAFVWAGGRSNVDRPYYLIANADYQRTQVTMLLAKRINETFHGPLGVSDKVALEKNNIQIALGVPAQYKLNMPHYLRVVRAIPVGNQDNNSEYRSTLENMLADPSTTMRAAIRLEALGQSGVPVLQTGLTSNYPLVRFASAEALAYLGSASAAEELSKLATEHPALQAYCLTALASLDEAAAGDRLEYMMAAEKPEVRYGAFRALRTQDAGSPIVKGELHNRSYWLHSVAPEATPLAHALTGKRAEIVLFGTGAALKAPFSLLVNNEFTLTGKQGDAACTITHFIRGGEKKIEQCPLDLTSVIRMMGKLGAGYGEVVEMLKQAHDNKALTCPLAIDALPKALTTNELALLGRDDPKMSVSTETDLLKQADGELGTTPGLFDKTALK